ncbi:hypothetical protein X773_21550 [Mesorhizobium sp. LSJC285A00]|nr:hypothetical protein X773_21550 [Mesorhizobium sp. LSJC285A00]
MCGGNLCSAAAIYQLESRDCAAFIIGAQDDATENAIPHDSRSNVTHTIAILLELEWSLLILKPGRRADLIDARQQRLADVQTQIDNTVEVAWANWADGRLGATRILSFVIEYASLNDTARPVERNRIGEIKVGSSLDQSEVHGRLHRIRNNLLDFGHGEVATGVFYLAGLVVDDPITDPCFDPTQILAGKLVLLSGAVIVDRI